MNDDPELKVMGQIHSLLESLEEEARPRVIDWLLKRFNVSEAVTAETRSRGQVSDENAVSKSDQAPSATRFASFGELFDAAQPKTNSQKVLVAGYWIQVVQQISDLTGHAINVELKHIGHGVSNVTVSFSELIRDRPALALQVRKLGKSQQSRKKYKLTEAGIKAVAAMLEKTD